ncbi:6156_t:CDS:2 [Dentiscutata heterogama]|uniref:6156_t:CDS:1 n=1 Tax=Dentiscutata heterogama TaxID=1316150 RepID=A0ACA9KEZ0_9GLOM|nr:6156_t:CDS:2 [Dentiscutata heterogama]
MNHKFINLFSTIFYSYLLSFAIIANAHHYETSENKISECCKARGSPGWTNIIHKAVYYDSAPQLDITTPEHCCQACVENPDCLQWTFKTSVNLCNLDVERNLPLKLCDLPTEQPTTSQEAGVIGCSDGCRNYPRKSEAAFIHSSFFIAKPSYSNIELIHEITYRYRFAVTCR